GARLWRPRRARSRGGRQGRSQRRRRLAVGSRRRRRLPAVLARRRPVRPPTRVEVARFVSGRRAIRFVAQCSSPPTVTAASWAALARRCEDLGYSTLTIADHLDDQLAPVPALMAAADATSKLRVGALVFCNDYKHPVVLAKEAATLDVLSGGRLELGLGAGWMT